MTYIEYWDKYKYLLTDEEQPKTQEEIEEEQLIEEEKLKNQLALYKKDLIVNKKFYIKFIEDFEKKIGKSFLELNEKELDKLIDLFKEYQESLKGE